VLKVVVEAGLWSDDTLREIAAAVVAGGADVVQVSSWFSSPETDTVRAVERLRRWVPAGVRIKASGGIRTSEDALAALTAGASRIGASATQVLAGLAVAL
jgi:deoxyribose-phosphate aldolase